MKKTSIGAGVGFVIGGIIGGILQPFLMQAMNITIPLEDPQVDLFKLLLAVFTPIPVGIIIGSIFGYVTVANREKSLFDKIEDLKGSNYTIDSEFFDTVGKRFQANPKYFMESLHRRLSKKVSKKYGNEKRREMERYIIEKYCLFDGEKILYEFDGSIDQKLSFNYKLSAVSGGIFITNQRIIALGTIRVISFGGGAFETASKAAPVEGAIADSIYFFTPTDIKKAKNQFIEFSVGQELPCYGYIFPVKNLFDLKMKRLSTEYSVKYDNKTYNIKITSPSFKDIEKIEELNEILISIQ